MVDGSGMQAQEPASALNKAGFEKVFVLKEGIAGWSGENLLWYAANNLPRVVMPPRFLFTPDVKRTQAAA